MLETRPFRIWTYRIPNIVRFFLWHRVIYRSETLKTWAFLGPVFVFLSSFSLFMTDFLDRFGKKKPKPFRAATVPSKSAGGRRSDVARELRKRPRKGQDR